MYIVTLLVPRHHLSPRLSNCLPTENRALRPEVDVTGGDAETYVGFILACLQAESLIPFSTSLECRAASESLFKVPCICKTSAIKMHLFLGENSHKAPTVN